MTEQIYLTKRMDIKIYCKKINDLIVIDEFKTCSEFEKELYEVIK